MTNTVKAYGRVEGGTVHVSGAQGDSKKQRFELSVTDGETRVRLDFMLTAAQLFDVLTGGTAHAVEMRRFEVSVVDGDDVGAVLQRLAKQKD